MLVLFVCSIVNRLSLGNYIERVVVQDLPQKEPIHTAGNWRIRAGFREMDVVVGLLFQFLPNMDGPYVEYWDNADQPPVRTG